MLTRPAVAWGGMLVFMGPSPELATGVTTKDRGVWHGT